MIEDKLRDLGVYPDAITQTAEIFGRIQKPEDLRDEMRRLGKSLGGDQFLYHHFIALVTKRPELIDEAVETINVEGVSPELVREYFGYSSADPGNVFSMRHGEIPNETRIELYDKALQFAFDKMKDYLGLRPEES
jgi:hypothetical protein|tara:strand:+ start:326 stop:730 length:405 start_codon:yes stop_codon:yes gene_type:complete